MNAHDLDLVIRGALFACSAVAAIFFLRFWRSSRDRLFLFFSAAFWLLGLNWLSLAVIHWVPETRHNAFWARLLAFALIIFGIVDKNRRARRS